MTEFLVEYETEYEDLLGLAMFHFRNSASGRSAREKGTLAAVIFMLVPAMIAGFVTHNEVWMFIGLLGAPLAGFLYQPLLRRAVRRSADRSYREGRNEGVIGWHRLTLQGDGVTEESRAGSQFSKYSSIEKIPETDDYAFIYVTSFSAHVIPKKRLSRGDYHEFITSLRTRVNTKRD